MTINAMTLTDWLVVGSAAAACAVGLFAGSFDAVGFGLSAVWYLFFRDAQERIKELEAKNR